LSFIPLGNVEHTVVKDFNTTDKRENENIVSDLVKMEGKKEIPVCRTLSKIKIEEQDLEGNLIKREVFVDEKGNIINEENIEDINGTFENELNKTE